LAAWRQPILDRRLGKILLVSVVVGLCAIRAYVGLIGSRLFSHDAFMLFDGAWRMMNGQKPHLDFYSHLGFLSYVPTLLGLWIARGSAWGFGYGQALMGIIMGVWTFVLGRKRLADLSLTLMCIAITLMTVAPFALGFPLKVGPSTTYNRLGYALIALCILEAIAETSGSDSDEFRGGFSSGCVLAISLFLKITYFATTGLLLVMLIPCRTKKKIRWAGIAAGFLAVLLACCAYFGFNMRPMLHDLVTIGGAKRIHPGAYLIDEILQNAAIALAFVALAALLLKDYGQTGWRVFWAGLVVCCAGLALILGNSEESGFPLAAFLAIMVLDKVNLLLPISSERTQFPRFAVFLIGSVLIGASLFSGLLGSAIGVAGRIYIPHRVAPLQSPILNGFIPAGDDFSYGEFVNDGLALVNRYRHPGDTIMSLDFTNPFSYSLAMKPAPGGTTVLQYRTTFSDRFRPSPSFLFGSADLVALPKKFSDGSLDVVIEGFYGPYLRSHFREIAQSRDWRLFYRANS
jgi:hypothetical protein